MGNNGSGQQAYKNNPQQLNQYVQSLPREGRGRGSSAAAAQKYYNGGFKVLPERVPGQKLRMTDNGNLLQNGGTLSGRRLGGEAPETDVEFAQLMKRRSDIAKGSPKESYDDSSLGHHKGDNGTMGKKYHSNPDLLNSHGIISGNPSGILPPDQKKKNKLQKKTKAPPPPQGYAEEDLMQPYTYEKESHSPVKEKKRPFANFLKPSSKKLNEARKTSPIRQDFGPGAGHQSGDRPASGSPPSSSINAEITAAKLNSKDKSVTYVLERRDYHSSTSVLNTSKVQNQILTDSATGDRRYAKSPDSGKPPQPHGGYHAQLQGKLSDGGLQAQTIDRAEIRNKAFEIQKRVRSMDSLACSSDERDIHHHQHQQQQQQSSPLRNELHERFAKQSREIKSMDNLQSAMHNGKSGPLGRQPSNSSSLLSDRNRERPAWDKAQSRHRHPNDLDNSGPTRPMSMPYPRDKDGHSSREFLNRSDSNNRNAYYYGGGQGKQANYSPNQRIKDSFPGSLGRRENGDAKVQHQRTPSGSTMPVGQPRKLPEEPEVRHRDQPDGSHRLSNLEINKNFNQSQYNRNLDQFSKDKLRPMNSKEIIINTVREGEQASPKTSKEYHDKDAVSEHLQDAFFAKTKETRAGVIEYNRKLASGRHVRESNQVKSSDGDLSSEDEMDINMQLRPTLPKRLQSMPRFSPQQVWRSFSLDEVGISDKCSEHSSDGEEGDVFEDRILRVARPVAPPRSNNEKSADSGISPGAGSPGPVPYDFDAVVIPEKCPPTSPPPPPPLLTHKNLSRLQSPVFYPSEPMGPFAAKDVVRMSEQNDNGRGSHHQYDPPGKGAEEKNPLWTPEEDLASDFDAGSGDHQAANLPSWTAPSREMISTQPKLISRKDMFVSKKPTNGSLLMDNDYSDAEGMATNGKSGKKSKGPKNGEPNSPQKYNSVRKLKRSLSGVLQGHVRVKTGEETTTNLDDNWSLSRSLPNSLHNGHEGERTEKKQSPPQERGKQVTSSAMSHQRLPRSESGPIYVAPKHSSEFVERQPFTDLEGRAFSRERARAAIGAGTRYNRNGHIVYLPKYEAMEIIEENMDPTGMERRAYSDLGMGSKSPKNMNNLSHFPFKKPKKFTYQSTVRQNERKQLEQMLSQEVAVKEKQRAREMDLVNKVEEEFQKKRDREKADIRQQLRILSLESSNNEDLSNGYYESSRSLPREYPNFDDRDRSSSSNNNAVIEVRDTSSMNRNEHGHLSLPPLIIPPEDYDLTIPKDSTKLKLGSLPGRNSRDYAQPPNSKSYGKGDPLGDSPQSSGFFSGIGKWMRRQQRLEKHGDHVPSRQEPEGAPSAYGPSSLPLHDGDRLSPEHSSKGPPSSIPSSPHHENRSNAIVGAKFSSGRMPDGQAFQPSMPAASPQQRKTIYSHLAEVAEKEEHLRQKQQQGRNHGEKDARTSVWISSDKSYPIPSPSKASDGHNVPNDRTYSDFYEVPYDSLVPPGNRLDPNFGQKSRYDKLQSKSDDDMLDNYNRARRGAGHSAVQRDWNAGQRHSIAVDPSRDQWATGIIPPPRGFDEGRRQSRDSDFTSSNSYSTQNNGHGEHGWNRGVGRQDSYRESMEEDEYRRRSMDPTPLTTHHRSLSFSHINSEGGQSNGRKPNNASPRQAVPPVQPFHPNKAYRPVAFQTGNHGFPKW